MAMRTSRSVGSGLSRRNSSNVVSIPGVQKPHCRPWLSRNASCKGCSLSGDGAMPSTVRISWPSACTASIKQERAERPSSRMVQAPHTPCSQPRCVPVRPSSTRRKSASVRRTGTSLLYDLLLTVTEMVRLSVMSVDHFIGPAQQGMRQSEAKRLSRFQIDDQFELDRAVDRQIDGLGAFEHTASKHSHPVIGI